MKQPTSSRSNFPWKCAEDFRSRPTRVGRRTVAMLLLVAAGIHFTATAPANAQDTADSAANSPASSAANSAASSAARTIDFAKDIAPILKQKCFQCHGPMDPRGGLRLDTKLHAAAGANSGVPILGGDLVSNGIFQRIISDDESFRMPRDDAPLSAAQIETIRQWVLQGTPWPDDVDSADADKSGFVTAVTAFVDRHQGYLAQLIVLLTLVVAIEIWRGLYRQRNAWTTGRAHRISLFVQKIRFSHHVIALLVFAVYFIAMTGKEKSAAIEATAVELRTKLDRWENPTTESIYGLPPVPFRPGVPPTIASVYYRGNCERNPKLQNGGNYRTGTFYLNLCNTFGDPVQMGDTVGGNGLCVRLKLERAPYTSNVLYSDAIMSAIFFTKHYLTPEKPDNDFVQFKNIDYQSTWTADFPIGSIPTNGTGKLSGLVYLCQGYSGKRTVAERYHFGIKYDLLVKNGRIAQGSDLWMGSLFWTQELAVPQPDKVPMHEWFDHRPIAVLKRENTSDPDLIGVGDYYLQQNTEPTPPSAN